MGRCPNCGAQLPASSRFCGFCGQPLAPSSAIETEALPVQHAPSGPQHGRFLPGEVLAGRYRIVGLLGRGGMGEVYRADDMKLGQAVALKFLPPGLDTQPDRLARFLGEVRTARQVSHPNVCRIYDAGEADGQHFLSMEYVDGEDLASLLRRIGHLPKDKAIQIARELCAGLAASHEMGVLHRDLKPANVMIDGRGHARITDFGLAREGPRIEGADVLSGTPAYMAPEQLAGREVTVRSDLYSLGLVLYELFTGKPAFKAKSVADLQRLQSETTPSSPSSFVEGFDPAVERVILRCLDHDPARRPSSALAIAAALPGGDPLAAALAAGETPSPEMVAQAAVDGAASPTFAWGALLLFLACFAASFVLSARTTLVGLVPLDKPPAFLAERAREILVQAGHAAKPADSLFEFTSNRPYLEDRLRRGEAIGPAPPGAALFWYRQSPRQLDRIASGTILRWMEDPPSTTPGMARVALDPDGRLVSLLVVPGQRTQAVAPAEPDWEPLLRATGVDAATLVPVAPEWAPPVYADRRSAWTGTWPEKPSLPVRIEAAAAGGRPVSLELILPWTRPAEQASEPPGFWNRLARIVNATWFIAVLAVGGLVALRNVRRGRGDRRGALRFALYLGAARMVWYVGAHHSLSTNEVDVFNAHLAYALERVGLTYVLYLAIEPYARRLWPRMLTSWVRVLEGRFRDPLVGRDLLMGCAAGALIALLGRVADWLPALVGGTPPLPIGTDIALEPLRGTVPTLLTLAAINTWQLFDLFIPLTSILVFRLLLRRTWPALVAVSLLALALFYPESGSIPLYVVMLPLSLTIAWIVLFRGGLLAFGATSIVNALIEQLPITPHAPAWLLGTTLLCAAVVLAPALYGFFTCQAGRPLLGEAILEPAVRR